MRSFRLAWWPIVWVACGGDDADAPGGTDTTDSAPTIAGDDDDDDLTGSTGDVVTVSIEAAAGGTVEAFCATLEIPAGALAADTEITVSEGPATGLPDEGAVVGRVFDFGPDGTTFSVPATLTLPADATLGADQEVVVSWLDGAAWVDLPSTGGAGTVSAPVAHFTDFAARAVAAGGDAECQTFAPCGGDVTGQWTPTAVCGDTRLETWSCDGTFVNLLTRTGGYVFEASGAFTYEVSDGTLHATQEVPSACVPAAATSCEQVYPASSGWVCTGDVTVSCTCETEYPVSASYAPTVGRWSVAGNELTTEIDRVGDAGPYVEVDVYPYCVTGDTLAILDGDEVHTYAR